MTFTCPYCGQDHATKQVGPISVALCSEIPGQEEDTHDRDH